MQDEDIASEFHFLGRSDERASARDPLPIDLFVKEVLYYLFWPIYRPGTSGKRKERERERFLRAKYSVAGCEGRPKGSRARARNVKSRG